MQRGVPARQTYLSQPQYLIPASYYRTKRGHQSPSSKEALKACFGCSPTYKFLIGIPLLQSEVEVKAIPTETMSLSQHHKQHGSLPLLATATISPFKTFVVFKSAVQGSRLSPLDCLTTPIFCVCLACVFHYDCWSMLAKILMLSVWF